MPYCHRWRGGREGVVCGARRIDRFLEPCLLLLLHCREVHGYELLDELKQFGFDQDPVDLSTIYRLLRAMEEMGLVTSRWDTGVAGPARRRYQLTAEGDRYLAAWVEDLRETDRVIHHFLETYDTHMAQHR